ncbi:MAG: DinB family protein [Alphaproteobacteria bacterium]
MRRLGAKSVPIISKGEKWVFAQNIKVVADFCGVTDLPTQLPPETLVEKLDMVISGAQRFIRQVPASCLGDMLPGRPRAFRDLFFHIFVIPESFLRATNGIPITYEYLATKAPPDATPDSIAAYGEDVKGRLHAWWDGVEDRSLKFNLATYYGDHTAHDVLERTAWHSGQHTRQVMFIHQTMGIPTDRPLTAEDLAGLPLPKDVWDG